MSFISIQPAIHPSIRQVLVCYLNLKEGMYRLHFAFLCAQIEVDALMHA
jgi:hypothetical protein